MNRFLSIPIVSLGLLGCNQPSSAPDVPDVVVAAAPAAATPPAAKPPAVTQPVAVQPKKEEPPAQTAFPFPTDAAGKLLPAVVTPNSSIPPPVEKFGKAPKARTVPGKLIEPDPLSKMTYVPTPLSSAKPAGLLPAAPTERVPLDLGIGATAVPAKPSFAEAPGITLKARDVALPPDLIPLGRQLPDRASLDDPTSEPGNSVIVSRTPMPTLGVSAFLKLVLPDPFEFADQVKPKVAPTAEPSLAPVPVNPQRVK